MRRAALLLLLATGCEVYAAAVVLDVITRRGPRRREPPPRSWLEYELAAPDDTTVLVAGGSPELHAVRRGAVVVMRPARKRAAADRLREITSDEKHVFRAFSFAEARRDGSWRFDWVATAGGKTRHYRSRRLALAPRAVDCEVVAATAGAANAGARLCELLRPAPTAPP